MTNQNKNLGYKVFSAYHILGAKGNTPVYFMILPSHFLIGISNDRTRFYTGKIGELNRNRADLCLYYVDTNQAKPIRKRQIVEYAKLFQGEMHFAGDTPSFFQEIYENQKKDAKGFLPKSEGKLYQTMKENSSLQEQMPRMIDYLIRQVRETDQSMIDITKTMWAYCSVCSDAISKDMFFDAFMEVYNARQNENSNDCSKQKVRG